MEKSVQITLIIVAGIVILLGFSILSNIVPSGNIVTGNGAAVIKVVPDLVAVYFNIETKGATSSEASEKNAEIVKNLKSALLMKDFEKKDIQTINFNIYPNYDWIDGRQTSKGYVAVHGIKVELSTEDAENIGEVIDAGVGAGAGISYINFELSQEKQNEYKIEAIKLAAQDARTKAEAMAEGLNKKLGALVSTSDSSFDYYPWRLYEATGGISMDASEAKQATTDIRPGEQEISARVTAVYRLR